MAESKEAERAEFSLQPLYKRPPPTWMHPAFLCEFGEAFLGGMAGGGLDVIMAAHSLVIDRAVAEQGAFLKRLTHEDLQALHAVTDLLRDGKEIARRLALAGKSGGSGLVNFLRNFRQKVLGLREGQFLVVPGGFGQHNMLHVLEHEGNNQRSKQ